MVYTKTITAAIPLALKSIDIHKLGQKKQGKVRDFWNINKKRILVTTDRLSAFDVVLGYIPFKGQVLNELSKFWFEKTKHILNNHMITVPDPNVMVVHDCEVIPIEMVVRGFMTGVTKTSIWYSYSRGERTIYGIKFPENLKKNQKLWEPIITPTTHGGGTSGHDDRLTHDEIIKKSLVDRKIYDQMVKSALALYEFGSKLCKRRGLVLVDTKYEFGLYKGELMLIDEIHTPDSSRFWLGDSYLTRLKKGIEPENFDKEFLRLWYAKRGYIGDGIPPKMPYDLIVNVSKRYIAVYEKITGKKFVPREYPIAVKIVNNLKKLY